MYYYVTLELRLRECYQAVPLKEISEIVRLHTSVGSEIIVLLFNDVTDLRHKAFTTSINSDKTAFAFHLFDSL